jgi:hypothetical protein
LRARYYNPSEGRFLSRDTWQIDINNPIELNRYGYTADNPVNFSDPSGNVGLIEWLTTTKTGIATVQVSTFLTVSIITQLLLHLTVTIAVSNNTVACELIRTNRCTYYLSTDSTKNLANVLRFHACGYIIISVASGGNVLLNVFAGVKRIATGLNIVSSIIGITGIALALKQPGKLLETAQKLENIAENNGNKNGRAKVVVIGISFEFEIDTW